MILEQHYLTCLAHASYLIGDPSSGLAVVVDPQRDVERYLESAEKHGLRIGWVVLTHFHADFVAGHLELARRTGAQIRLGARAKADYDFTPWPEGEALELGRVRLVPLETPGHTPEGICIQVFDLGADSPSPKALLTGDTLFVGDVGRPDLMASVGVTAEELASMLYDSLRDKLAGLPDGTLVYPAHGPGSACGKALGSETFSTLGEQRAKNWALQEMPKEQFVERLTSGLAQPPAYFGFDADLNRRERAVLDDRLPEALTPLEPNEVLERSAAGAVVLDVRDAEAFAAGHLEGAVNVGLDGKFAHWVGSLVDPRTEVVIVGREGQEHEAVVRLARVGFERVLGFARGGQEALEAAGAPVARWERIDPDDLRARLGGARPPLVLDIRAAGEWAEGHPEGALHVPLEQLEARMDEVPAGRELAVLCRSGYRSSIAASLLWRAGRQRLVDLRGGWLALHGAPQA
jgi:hydroxyacylglutathione hydrolase